MVRWIHDRPRLSLRWRTCRYAINRYIIWFHPPQGPLNNSPTYYFNLWLVLSKAGQGRLMDRQSRKPSPTVLPGVATNHVRKDWKELELQNQLMSDQYCSLYHYTKECKSLTKWEWTHLFLQNNINTARENIQEKYQYNYLLYICTIQSSHQMHHYH